MNPSKSIAPGNKEAPDRITKFHYRTFSGALQIQAVVQATCVTYSKLEKNYKTRFNWHIKLLLQEFFFRFSGIDAFAKHCHIIAAKRLLHF